MEKIAIYGKGGIGKSVISTNLSYYFAKSGKRVLHVGCDPKHDSSVKLLNDTNMRTVLDLLGDSPHAPSVSQIVNEGKLGIHCIEAGGPKPGLGCGGRGVAKTIEFIDEIQLLDDSNYDACVFDVLGDVVCGGFAAPLRLGMAKKVFIVISEEPMAMYAANNISKAINSYQFNGIVLGGLIANVRSRDADISFLENFARTLNTEIVKIIHRDPLVIESERMNQTVIEHSFDAPVSKEFITLAENILKINPADIALPTPMEDQQFFEFIKG